MEVTFVPIIVINVTNDWEKERFYFDIPIVGMMLVYHIFLLEPLAFTLLLWHWISNQDFTVRIRTAA